MLRQGAQAARNYESPIVAFFCHSTAPLVASWPRRLKPPAAFGRRHRYLHVDEKRPNTDVCGQVDLQSVPASPPPPLRITSYGNHATEKTDQEEESGSVPNSLTPQKKCQGNQVIHGNSSPVRDAAEALATRIRDDYKIHIQSAITFFKSVAKKDHAWYILYSSWVEEAIQLMRHIDAPTRKIREMLQALPVEREPTSGSMEEKVQKIYDVALQLAQEPVHDMSGESMKEYLDSLIDAFSVLRAVGEVLPAMAMKNLDPYPNMRAYILRKHQRTSNTLLATFGSPVKIDRDSREFWVTLTMPEKEMNPKAPFEYLQVGAASPNSVENNNTVKPLPTPAIKKEPSGTIDSNKLSPRLDVKKDPPSIVDSKSLQLTPIETPRPPIPQLQYGLSRVLFNPGVYQLQDERTGVYNFDPYLAHPMPIEEFDFNAVRSYVTSSKDTTLIDLALSQGKKYAGSTSSMTAVLSHFHFLLSAWRPLDFRHTSKFLRPESTNFTRITRTPAAIFLHYKNGSYAIDADKEFDTATVLSMLGHSMEKFLTMPREDFEKYRRSRSHELTLEERNDEQAYNYTTLGDFLMRSQLDSKDPRLPGTGVFDLKTRAVVSIRMDSRNIRKALGYQLRSRFGQWESFEREYYDMIRSAFLKYSLQARMGRMDGIFVAYHNVEQIFGFQYFPISELDVAIHGTENTELGDREFKLSAFLLNKALDIFTRKCPGKSLRLHFETREGAGKKAYMHIFAKPVTSEEIEEIQNANHESIEKFEKDILGIIRNESDLDKGIATGETIQPESWDEVCTRAWKAHIDDKIEAEEIREAIADALEESGLIDFSQEETKTSRYVETVTELLQVPSLMENTTKQEIESTEESSEEYDENTMSIVVPSLSRLRKLLLDRRDGSEPASSSTSSETDHRGHAGVREFERLFCTSLARMARPPPHPSVRIAEADERTDNLMGLVLTIKNTVNGKVVNRPKVIKTCDDWKVAYRFEEISPRVLRPMYRNVLRRRKDELDSADRDAVWHKMWSGQLDRLSKQGRRRRIERLKREFGKDIIVYGRHTPKKWVHAFEQGQLFWQLWAAKKFAPEVLNRVPRRLLFQHLPRKDILRILGGGQLRSSPRLSVVQAESTACSFKSVPIEITNPNDSQADAPTHNSSKNASTEPTNPANSAKSAPTQPIRLPYSRRRILRLKNLSSGPSKRIIPVGRPRRGLTLRRLQITHVGDNVESATVESNRSSTRKLPFLSVMTPKSEENRQLDVSSSTWCVPPDSMFNGQDKKASDEARHQQSHGETNTADNRIDKNQRYENGNRNLQKSQGKAFKASESQAEGFFSRVFNFFK